MSLCESTFFITGGTLSCDAPSYVERQADHQLWEALQRGEYCYVLTSRQMGKSSLMVRTAARLEEEGASVVVLDLTAVGQNLSAEQWYDGLLSLVGQQLGLEDELDAFWREHRRLGPLQRFFAALDHCVPTERKDQRAESRGQGAADPDSQPSTRNPQPAKRLIVFIDEIDAVRGLGFSTDEFFAAMRECYNRRSQDPRFERLTFCLLGVASPSDLIRDTRLTPFNVGRRIELSDFTAEEAAILAIGLEVGDLKTPGRPAKEARALLERVLYWTRGHPYLTQRLCQVVAADRSVHDAAGVDRRCEALFLARGAREKDDNLLFVRERLLRSEADRAALLDLYRQVRERKRVRNDDANALHGLLKLAGVARVVEGCLRVRNRIYYRAFDREWVLAHIPGAEVRRQKVAFRRGVVRATAVAAVLLALVSALAGTAIYQYRLSQARLARMYVASGMRQVEDGDAFRALPWLVEALRLESGDPRREQIHRVRIAAVLRDCPKLVGVWAGGEPALCAAFTADGPRVLTAGPIPAERLVPAPGTQNVNAVVLVADGPSRVATLWDPVSGRPCGPPLRCSSSVQGAEFTADGRLLVTLNADRTAQVWDTHTGTAIGPALRNSADIRFAVFDPAGRRLVTGSADGTARVWDAATGRSVGPPLRHPGGLRQAVLGPGGRRMITLGGGPAWVDTYRTPKVIARIWDVATGAAIGPPLAHPGEIMHAAFSPDGRRVATTGRDMTARVWDAATGRRLTPPLKHDDWVWRASFSPDGRRLVTMCGLTHPAARIWDAATGEPAGSPLTHSDDLNGASFSPDSRRLVTLSEDSTARVWDTASGMPVTPFLPGSAPVWRASFSADGRQVLTWSQDGTVRVWDLAGAAAPILSPPSTVSVRTGSFSPDGRRVVMAGNDGTARILDAATGDPVSPPLHAVEDGASYAAFSPDGREVVVTAGDRWDWKRGKGAARVFDAATRRLLGPPLHRGPSLTCASFSPEGRRLVTASADGSARVWDWRTGTALTPVLRHQGIVMNACFSPDGRSVITANDGGTVRIWDAASGAALTPPLRHHGTVLKVATSPDGRRVATASLDGTARIWDAAMGQPAGPVMSQQKPVMMAVTFSPDGLRIATGGSDRTARVRDAATGSPVTPPLRHAGFVRCVVFSSDGRLLATAAEESVAARLWDAETGEPVTPPLRYGRGWGDSETVAFNVDGRRLLTKDGNGTPVIWDLSRDDRPLGDLQLLALVLSGRRLTAGGSDVPVGLPAWQRAWQAILSRHPAAFAVSPAEVGRWERCDVSDAEREQQWPSAIVRLSRMIAAEPGRWPLHEMRAENYLEVGQWEKAAADLRQATGMGDGDVQTWYRLALLRAASGDAAGYRSTCAALLDAMGLTPDPAEVRWAAWACSIAPGSGSAVERSLGPAEAALQAHHADAGLRQSYGAALYRTGRWKEAAAVLRSGTGASDSSRAYTPFFRAMVDWRLGHQLESRTHLDAAVRQSEQELAANPPPPWNRRLTLRLLRREAESLVRPPRRR